MPARPTFEFKTTGGHTVILREYITGAENWAIRQIYMRGLGKEADSGTTAFEAEKKALELVAVSFDGKADAIADRILECPSRNTARSSRPSAPSLKVKKNPRPRSAVCQ